MLLQLKIRNGSKHYNNMKLTHGQSWYTYSSMIELSSWLNTNDQQYIVFKIAGQRDFIRGM